MLFADALDILWTYRQGFLSGLRVTMELTSIIWISGLVLGSALGASGAKYPDGIGAISRWVSFTLSGIPILVFLFWLHYPAQAMFNLVIDPFWTAAFTFSLINIFAVSDMVRNHIDDFPAQYLTAAKVCGLKPKQIVWKIQFPLITRQILPGMMVLQITMLHMTILASLISVEEIFRVAQRINASIYKPVEIYTALGVFFLAVSLPINGLALWLKQKYTRNISER